MSAGEWLVERGIGEDRAILVRHGQVVAARLDWPGRLSPGQVEDAVLISRRAGSQRGTARFASGEQALVDGLARDVCEGARLRLAITRSAIAESGRDKLARARPTAMPPCPAPGLAQGLGGSGHGVRLVHRFPDDPWPDLFAQAWDGHVDFPGGSLSITPTPAMTLIDVDGDAPGPQLALAAVPAIAVAIGRFALAGSIGIDFPTIAGKQDRRRLDAALAEMLVGWPHEATAMNGFGFVQLISRLETPSIVQRIRLDRAGAAARLLLRRAEMVEQAGTLCLTCHPVVRKAIGPDWEDALSRRTGRRIGWQLDPGLALAGGFAQAVAP